MANRLDLSVTNPQNPNTQISQSQKTPNSIIQIGELFCKISQHFTEINVQLNGLRDKRETDFDEAHQRLYNTFKVWPFSLTFAGIAIEMAGAVKNPHSNPFSGAKDIGSVLTQVTNKNFESQQTVAQGDITKSQEGTRRLSTQFDQVKQFITTIHQTAQNILDSLTKSFMKQ